MAKQRERAQPKSSSARSSGAVDAAIGAAVRARRLTIAMSQERLALMIGITFQQVQKYEKGVNRIAASTLIRIAAALGCAPSDLLPASAQASAAQVVDASVVGEIAGVVAGLNAEGRRALLKVARSFARDPDYAAKSRKDG